MSQYLIHACNDRLWYVRDYLVPSMLKQGIDNNDIRVYLDKDSDGCLESCMKAFLTVPINAKGTWHLQDDVIICHDFKERTEVLEDERVVCGFCFSEDARARNSGYVNVEDIWYSFPCIKIPNIIARGCADWYFRYVKYADAYRIWVKSQKYDDSVFHVYLQDFYADEKVLNLSPNLVDHIDYVIGGSIINKIRPEKETHSVCFNDTYLVRMLEEELQYVR